MEFTLELPEEPQNVFSVYGKAVYLALRFEEYIAGLAFLSSWHEPQKVLKSDDNIRNFIKAMNEVGAPELADTLQSLRNIVSGDLYDIFNKARKSRNSLLHSPGPFAVFGEADFSQIEENVRNIAAAHLALVHLSARFTGQSAPEYGRAKTYVEDTVAWIFKA